MTSSSSPAGRAQPVGDQQTLKDALVALFGVVGEAGHGRWHGPWMTS